MFSIGHLTWVSNQSSPFRRVVAVTGIDHIGIVTYLLNRLHLRYQVVNAEGGMTIREPAFAEQTVDTTKVKLVAQPGFVGDIVYVTLQPMATNMGNSGIGERVPSRHK